ncbi:hypothetical protein [Haloparvum sedimenti]|uniref:hypothetical protein n=1 Tax=Haloparvum sedimenti TaxID=1678448 RepID=UPI00071E7F34|nr:hypothetical protein [Haloparvum sedimenti]
MPATSQHNEQAATTPNPFPDMAAQYGENPARFLSLSLEPDGGDGSSGELILARIRGLETIEMCGFWLGVERALANKHDREPRARIERALRDRKAELEAQGDGLSTSGTTPAERRARGERLREEQPDRVESCAVLLDKDGEERPWSSQQGARVHA